MSAYCPVCHSPSKHLKSLTFSKTANLPEFVDIFVCEECDLGFSEPRNAEAYSKYYSSTVNDTYGFDTTLTAEAQKRYMDQMEVLRPVLMGSRQMRILDVGCGQAGLLRTLFQQYPENSYYAVDPNVSSTQLADKQIHFSDDWKSLEGTFDLIILSHTIEHLVDFDDIAELSGHLSATGQLYIEVPDAATYIDYQRREFLYYFDRLHVNHFTVQSLLRFVEQLGLFVVTAGRNDFDYKDGAPYPAIYVRATPTRSTRQEDNAIACSLLQLLQNYIAIESDRAKALQLKLLDRSEVVAYGFGDNFFRSVSIDGPLHNVPLAGVIDRRYSNLSKSKYADTYRFLDIDECCATFPAATYVVTVSWGYIEVQKALQERGIKDIVFI